MSIEILQSDAKRAVARLAGLNNDELDAIMNDDGKIEAILDGLDQVCIVDTLSRTFMDLRQVILVLHILVCSFLQGLAPFDVIVNCQYYLSSCLLK